MAHIHYCCGHGLLAHGPEALHEDYAARIEKAMGQPLPQMELRFSDLTLTAQVPAQMKASRQLPTIGNELKRAVSLGRTQTVKKHILRNISGIFEPGKMTLVLGQPGSGKSALMKILSGRFPMSKTVQLSGEIEYNGVAQKKMDKRLAQFVTYVPQRDCHYSTLTVKETLAFAHECCGPELSPEDERQFSFGTADENAAALKAARVLYKHYPAIVTQTLGLDHCEDTVVGDGTLRGVSGGERKRVTIGEMEFGNRLVMFMDEISTGLDSAATFDIVKTQRSMGKKLRKTVVMALLQPSPEVFELFDNVLILNDGEMVYHGPRNQVVPYFESLGFVCPHDRDIADFLIDIGTSRQSQYASSNCSYVQRPMTPADLAKIFRDSTIYEHQSQQLRRMVPCAVLHPFEERLRHSPEFHQSFWKSTATLVRREIRVTWRNKEYMMGRVAMLVIVGFLGATLFYNLDLKNTQSVLGTILTLCLYFMLSQPALSPLFVAGRDIFYKQRDASFYRTSSYVLAVAVNQTLLAIPDVVGFCSIVYWMVGFVNEFQAFAILVATLFLMSLSLTGWTFLLSALLPSAALVESISTLQALIFTLFGGVFVTHASIPVYLSWAYWLNPVAWAVRSISINQYTNQHLDTCQYGGIDYCKLYAKSMGHYSLESFDIYPQRHWIWLGMAFLLSNAVVCFVLAGFVLGRVRHEPSTHRATKIHEHTDDEFNADDIDLSFDVNLDHDLEEGAHVAVLSPRYVWRPRRVTLAFRDLRYYVPDPNNRQQEIELLKGVSGFAKPGTITALMGSSGAGKTTLMDVIAGRKTGGKISGQIFLNGHEATELAIRRCTGYCEQMDVHSETATFREALIFSAFLRQGAEICEMKKRHAVDEVLDLLDLLPIADQIIRGSSPEQKKRLSIGVELVAQPSVLFLDEPTSGLDAYAAKLIMDGVRKVADTGRTVICTIHQPSWEIFQVFDNLLLLQRGGEMVYFGNIGHDASELIEYFEAIDGVAPLGRGCNPASWMLDVIGAGVGVSAMARGRKISFAQRFKTSAKHALLQWNLSQYGVARAEPGVRSLDFQGKRVASNREQFTRLLQRFWRMYWRATEYNLTRMVLGVVLALVFGLAFGRTHLDTYNGVNTAVTMVGISSVFLGIVAFDSVIPFTFADRAAFYRERAAQTYNALWYALASSLVEIPYALAMGFFFTCIFFPLAGFTGAARFVVYWLLLSLHVLVQTYVGQLVALATPSVEVATTLGLLVNSVSFLFMGFNPPVAAIPSGYQWLHVLVAPKYTLAALVGSVFGACDDAATDLADLGCARLAELPPTLPAGLSAAQYLRRVFQIDARDVARHALVLLGVAVAARARGRRAAPGAPWDPVRSYATYAQHKRRMERKIWGTPVPIAKKRFRDGSLVEEAKKTPFENP